MFFGKMRNPVDLQFWLCTYCDLQASVWGNVPSSSTCCGSTSLGAHLQDKVKQACVRILVLTRSRALVKLVCFFGLVFLICKRGLTMLIAQGFRGELNEVRWVRCFLRKAIFFFFWSKEYEPWNHSHSGSTLFCSSLAA